MAQWLVLKGRDNQFAVNSMADLRTLAQRGELRLGDLIQPPGTTEWLYVDEVGELKKHCKRSAEEDDDAPRSTSPLLLVGAAVLLGVVALSGAAVMYVNFQNLPTGEERIIGQGGLTYSEMVVTASGTGLRGAPDAKASPNLAVAQNDVLDLLAKRGLFYKARTKAGAEGWIPVDHVIPMYQLGGEKVREEFDPLYNPDRYFEVANASWQQLPDAEDGKTVFQFMLKNQSRYDMTDLVILATIKDSKGQEIERVEIPIEGVIPADSVTMVGTLAPEAPQGKKRKPAEEEVEAPKRHLTEHTFNLLAKDNPDLQLQYSAGVDVSLKSVDFTNAAIDPLELRAVPSGAAPK